MYVTSLILAKALRGKNTFGSKYYRCDLQLCKLKMEIIKIPLGVDASSAAGR